MKTSHFFLLITILLLSSLLAACTGGAGAASSWPGLSVDASGETAYLAYNTHVYAINLLNGTEEWRYPKEADNKVTFFAPPALTEDGQLVVGGYDKVLHSLDLESKGSPNWTFEGSEKSYVAGPLASGESIYAPSSDNNLYALDVGGNPRWVFEESKHALWSTPVTDDDTIYQPSMDHHVYAIDAETRASRWVSEDLGGAIAGAPTLGQENVLYVGTFGNQVVALDTSSGEIKWKFQATGWVWAGPLLHEGILYFGDLEGTIFAVDAADQTEIWRIQPDTSPERAITGRPVILEDTLYFAAQSGNLYALEPSSGGIRWTKTFEGEFRSDLVAVGDVILMAPIQTDPILIAVDPNGNQKWAFVPEKK